MTETFEDMQDRLTTRLTDRTAHTLDYDKLNALEDRVVGLESRQIALDNKFLALEKKVAALEFLQSTSASVCPISPASMLYPPGDPVPSHGVQDTLDGMIYAFFREGIKRPYRFYKNKSGGCLGAGSKIEGGTVDRSLRHIVMPNNFCLLELWDE